MNSSLPATRRLGVNFSHTKRQRKPRTVAVQPRAHETIESADPAAVPLAAHAAHAAPAALTRQRGRDHQAAAAAHSLPRHAAAHGALARTRLARLAGGAWTA